jgi:hypothetical protein
MPRYRLLSPHYINDMLLEAGTEVGEGTQVPFSGRPSAEMEGCDPESEKLAKARRDNFIDVGRALSVIDKVTVGAK